VSEEKVRSIQAGDITDCPWCKDKEDLYDDNCPCPTCLNMRQVIWRLQPCILPRQEEKARGNGTGAT